jgi:hypothetical protein
MHHTLKNIKDYDYGLDEVAGCAEMHACIEA